MRRKHFFIVIISMLSIILIGCTNSMEGQKEEEKLALKWAIWDQNQNPYWTEIKEEYEAAYPNITIEMVELGAYEYMTILATELSENDSDFDVVSIKDVPNYSTLVSKKILEPLNDYIIRWDMDLEQYGGVDKQVTIDGKLYELPFRNDFWVIFYNKDIFDRAEVDYPTNDMTFKEFDNIARKVTDTHEKTQIYGTHYHIWRSTIQLFGVLDGEHSILDGNYDFFKPYYEMVLKQEDDKVTRNYSALSAESLHYSAAFSGGDVAMLNMGSWFISTMISKLATGEFDASLCGNWGIVKYPHNEGVEAGATIGTITGLAIPSSSKKKEEAFRFIQWVSGVEGAKILARTGSFPTIMNDEVVNIISGLEGFPKDEESKEALHVSRLYLEVPYAEKVAPINDILDIYHKSIMYREVTIDEGIRLMNEKVGELLNK